MVTARARALQREHGRQAPLLRLEGADHMGEALLSVAHPQRLPRGMRQWAQALGFLDSAGVVSLRLPAELLAHALLHRGGDSNPRRFQI